jgi:hypothetical protein
MVSTSPCFDDGSRGGGCTDSCHNVRWLPRHSGMMNGVPWIVAASTDNGVEFGIFVNTLGWVYGTASAARQQLDLYSTKAAAVDILVVTWPTGSSPSGSTRADSIQGMLCTCLKKIHQHGSLKQHHSSDTAQVGMRTSLGTFQS